MSTPTFTVTAADVFARFKLPDASPARLTDMQDIIDGVVGVINETTLDWPADPDDHPGRLPATEQAILLMAHRVWMRSGSPLGAAGFGPDQSLIRVVRTDPDVEFFVAPWSIADIPV